MAEMSSDDLNLKIGDLLSHPLYHATRQPCARPFMLMRPIQAHSCMFARAPVQGCAAASRAHHFFQAIFSHALSRVLPVKENGRLAPARVAQAEQPWGSIRRDGLPASLGAHWEGGL